MNEDRLIEIETKLAFHEKTIKDLNDVIYEQQKEITRLKEICDTLIKKDKALSSSPAKNRGPANEKPPHY